MIMKLSLGPKNFIFSQSISRFSKFFETVDIIKTAGTILLGLCVLFGGIIIYKLIFVKKNLTRLPVETLGKAHEELPAWSVPPAKSFGDYESSFSQRDLFDKYQDRTAAPESSASTPIAPQSVNELANLQLIGVWVDEVPQAVLQDTQTKETYFLIKGDTFKSAVVEDVQEGKITFNYQDKKIDILQP